MVQYCCDGHKLHHDGTCRRLEEETRPKEQAKNSKNYAAREYLKAILSNYGNSDFDIRTLKDILKN